MDTNPSSGIDSTTTTSQSTRLERPDVQQEFAEHENKEVAESEPQRAIDQKENKCIIKCSHRRDETDGSPIFPLVEKNVQSRLARQGEGEEPACEDRVRADWLEWGDGV
jgi:hypothetical protein